MCKVQNAITYNGEIRYIVEIITISRSVNTQLAECLYMIILEYPLQLLFCLDVQCIIIQL